MEIHERIRLGYERFNRRDWDAVARGLPETFEAVDHLDARSARGPNALREITTANADTAFPAMTMEPVEILVMPDPDGRERVLVRVIATGRGGTSGLEVQDEVGQIWTFEGGVPVRFEQFRTWEETQRAAGSERR
jgi:hypothetical protein